MTQHTLHNAHCTYTQKQTQQMIAKPKNMNKTKAKNLQYPQQVQEIERSIRNTAMKFKVNLKMI